MVLTSRPPGDTGIKTPFFPKGPPLCYSWSGRNLLLSPRWPIHDKKREHAILHRSRPGFTHAKSLKKQHVPPFGNLAATAREIAGIK